MGQRDNFWILERKINKLVLQQNAVRAGIAGLINTHDLHPVYESHAFSQKMGHYGKALEKALEEAMGNLHEIMVLLEEPDDSSPKDA